MHAHYHHNSWSVERTHSKNKREKKITFIMPSAPSKIFSVVKSRSLFELQTINVFSIKEREEKQRSLHAKIYSRDERMLVPSSP